MLASLDHVRHALTRVLALLFVLVVATLTVACTDIPLAGPSSSATASTCPIPNPNLMPTAWKAQGNGTLINIDGDTDLECLVIYRYNITGDGLGPLGGIIFDPQVGADRVSTLATYRLLPWVNHSYTITGTVPGSLPGYLGTLGEKGFDVRLYDTDSNGKSDELGIVGSDAADNKTTLTLFRWVNVSDGYRLIGYFHGNTRVQIVDPPAQNADTEIYSGPVRTVRATDRFFDRSGLAMVYQYDRKDDGPRFEYRSNWIEFSDGRPQNTCFFPEGQTLLYYNDLNRPVFDLRLISEDDHAGKATVCAGSWDISPNTWRRYWAFVELEKRPTSSVGDCDQWVVMRELIEPGRTSCAP